MLTDAESYCITQHVEQIDRWLNKCGKKHSDPCNIPASTVLPKRLILFEDSPNKESLVTVHKEDASLQYVALSYCWGLKQNFTTKSDTLNEMEQQIQYHQLPKTLQHVFCIVRKLGFKYLWVDAICILQDPGSPEWKSEAAKMGDVYANATLVIGAMASPDVHAGLFIEIRDYSDEEKARFHNDMRTCRTLTQKDWHGRLQLTYPLLCRAWAFQERLLARRIVHFTAMELVWECKGDRWCKCGDEETENSVLSGNINNMNSAFRECRDNPTPSKIHLMWRECVKSFSKRDLTKLDDRLFAIDGIASCLRSPDPAAYADLYFHGLWKDALPWDLLWYCDQTSSLESNKSRSPSFSWSSVDCGIEWPTCDNCTLEDRFSRAISTGTCLEFRSKCEKEMKKILFLADAVTDGEALTIVSRITPIVLKHQDNPGQGASWLVENTKSEDSQTLPFYPDIQCGSSAEEQRYEGATKYYYVEIVSFDDGSAIRQAGLIVRRSHITNVEEQEELYERVGMAGDISCNMELGGGGWPIGGGLRTIVLV